MFFSLDNIFDTICHTYNLVFKRFSFEDMRRRLGVEEARLINQEEQTLKHPDTHSSEQRMI